MLRKHTHDCQNRQNSNIKLERKASLGAMVDDSSGFLDGAVLGAVIVGEGGMRHVVFAGGCLDVVGVIMRGRHGVVQVVLYRRRDQRC